MKIKNFITTEIQDGLVFMRSWDKPQTAEQVVGDLNFLGDLNLPLFSFKYIGDENV